MSGIINSMSNWGGHNKYPAPCVKFGKNKRGDTWSIFRFPIQKKCVFLQKKAKTIFCFAEIRGGRY